MIRILTRLLTSVCIFPAILFWPPLYAQNQLQVGYAVVTVEPDRQMPVASALFKLRNSQGVLVSEAGVAAVAPIARGRIFVDQEGNNTGIALANVSNEMVTLRIVLRGQDGLTVADERLLVLPAGQHAARFVGGDLFQELPEDFTGSLTFATVDPSHRVAAVTIRQGMNRHGEPLFATLPVVELPAEAEPGQETLVFPHLGAGSILSTQIILINPGAVRIRGKIELTGDQGEPLVLALDGEAGSSFDYDLRPHGTYRGTLTAQEGVFQGYAVVTSTGELLPAGTAIFQYRHPDGALVSEAGVGSVLPTTRARIFVDAAGTQTGVALANPGGSTATVEMMLRDLSGGKSVQAQWELGAGRQGARFAEQLFEVPVNFQGVMELDSPAEVHPVTLKLTVNERQELVLTTLPLADLTRPLGATELIFPQIGFGFAEGLEFSTDLILIAGTPGEGTSGQLSLTESSGAPMEVVLDGELASHFQYTLVSDSAASLQPGANLPLGEIVLDSANPALREVVVEAGGQLQLNPVVLDVRGGVRRDVPVEYTSVDPQVASVDSTGRITGHQPGFATLILSGGPVLTTATATVVGVTSGAGGFQVKGIAQDQSGRLYLAASSQEAILLAESLEEEPVVYAGVEQMPGLKDDVRLNALFDGPASLSLNLGDGGLYVADRDNHVIRRVPVSLEEFVETVAGSGISGSLDGVGTEAQFQQPAGVVLDGQGRLWVADTGNHTIRQVNLRTREVTTIAGKAGERGAADGSGDQARFDTPWGIAVEWEPLERQLEREATGEAPPPVRVVVADRGNGLIRRVSEDGMVETWGALSPARAAPAGAGTMAKLRMAEVPYGFSEPVGVAVDSFGNVYVTEAGTNELKTILVTGDVVPAAPAGTLAQPGQVAIIERGRLLVADEAQTSKSLRYGAPKIGTVDPPDVDGRGGEEILVKGRNFAPDTTVVLAGQVVPAQVTDSRTLAIQLPELPSGLQTLTVQNRGGVSQAAILVRAVPFNELSHQEITTVAGGSRHLGDGSDATEAPVALPDGLGVDSAGNVYVAEFFNDRVRRIDRRTGIITTFAGAGCLPVSDDCPLGDGGPASAASLARPTDVKLDASDNLYIADTYNHRVRRVDSATGVITTIAGNGAKGFSGDGGLAAEAVLNLPYGLALDPLGNLFISDGGNNRVRRVDAQSRIITTVAGSGDAGFNGDSIPAVEAELNFPIGLSISRGSLGSPAHGNRLFIADTRNERVRAVDLDTGMIATVAGTGETGFSGDGDLAVNAALNRPTSVFVDGKGNVFFTDRHNHRIRHIVQSSGVIKSIVGNDCDPAAGECPLGDGGPPLDANLSFPWSVLLDGSGKLIFSDTSHNRVRSVKPTTLVVETIAGNGLHTFTGDGGPAAASTLSYPRGVTADVSGNLYIADSGLHRIRYVDRESGEISTLAGTGIQGSAEDGIPAAQADLRSPRGITLDPSGNVYFSDTNNNQIRMIQRDTGLIFTVAGTGSGGFSGDGGLATQAELSAPRGLDFDEDGNLWFSDSFNNRVRKIDFKTGLISTEIGTGEAGFSGDGGPAGEAKLSSPIDVACDGEGQVYVSDRFNRRIRVLDTATGLLSTYAGNGERASKGDGGPAIEASFITPSGLWIEPNGDLYVADFRANLVRRIDAANGLISAVAGSGEQGLSGDGGPATLARLAWPIAVTMDGDGNLFVAEYYNSRIRGVRTPPGEK